MGAGQGGGTAHGDAVAANQIANRQIAALRDGAAVIGLTAGQGDGQWLNGQRTIGIAAGGKHIVGCPRTGKTGDFLYIATRSCIGGQSHTGTTLGKGAHGTKHLIVIEDATQGSASQSCQRAIGREGIGD